MKSESVNDTIAAISTPAGIGGIGILRISGPDSFKIATMHFKPAGFKGEAENVPDRYAAYGHIYIDTEKNILDEAILIKMKGPKSYTAEDVVEIQCHGGRTVLSALLRSVIDSGARPAEPGEFTKRAFLNGRIDLAQAEAVMDIISARTEEAAKNAARQMDGYYSARINEIKVPLIEVLAKAEAVLDYPEEDIEEEASDEIKKELVKILKSVNSFLKSYDGGRLLKEGASVVLAGPPNAGKSSLMNRLSGKYKSIVTEIPGTTRDILEEFISIKGIPVRLVDTAGLRAVEDKIENIGIDLASKEIKNADLVVYLLDRADIAGISEEILPETADLKGDRLIIAVNKSDLYDNNSPLEDINDDLKRKLLAAGFPAEAPVLIISALKGDGIEELTEKVGEILAKGFTGEAGNKENKEDILMTNLRHRDLMQKAADALERAVGAINGGLTLDCIASDIRDAIDYIGQITGESLTDEVENEIFSRFCIGK